MKAHDVFWKLHALSDRQLLERLGSMLGSTRRLMAELIAHLAEVEERRLHLAAACNSMFAYCLKLGMSEDEAYRRIEVARLARRYPAIFPMLAYGQLSLSVVALLKHHLSEENHLELLAALAGKTVSQSRELIASRFPLPDVASSVRKLPERRTVAQPSHAISPPTPPCNGDIESTTLTVMRPMEGSASTERATVISTGQSTTSAPAPEAPRTTGPGSPAPPTHSSVIAGGPVASRIEPLSAQRYKVQFTAGAELARKLELAKDLMRHSEPGGDLGPIVERAVDLLLDNLMQQRFGTRRKRKPARERTKRTVPEQHDDIMGGRAATSDTAEPHTTALADAPALDISKPDTDRLDSGDSAESPDRPDSGDSAESPDSATAARVPEGIVGRGRAPLERAPSSSYIPRSTRRAVAERDGLCCSWVDEDGARCGTQAWLEYDHRYPRAKGGGSEPDNLRLLCRAHNRLAAEREYGRQHVGQAIAERRRERAQHTAPAI